MTIEEKLLAFKTKLRVELWCILKRKYAVTNTKG